MRFSVAEEYPHISHDFTAVRRTVLAAIASKYEESHHVDGAMTAFESTRSRVDEHLYPDSVKCLKWLRSKGIRCCVLTNGSADIMACSALRDFLELSLNAGDVGASKPSVVPFMALSLLTAVPPSRILYIGDSYEHDVIGAKRAGMHSAILLRGASEGVIYSNIRPDYELPCLDPETLSVLLKIRP